MISKYCTPTSKHLSLAALCVQECVSQLSRLGVSDVMGNLIESEEEEHGDTLQEDGGSTTKSPSAQDFTDITEVVSTSSAS